MASITFTGTQVLDLGRGFLDRNAWTLVGSNAIARTIQRIKTEHRNVSDSQAKAYSSKGPIYVPITRGGGRTKKSLGGREVITKHDIKRAHAGHFAANEAASFLNTFPGGKQFRAPTQEGQRTPSGKSMKFANYAAYKRFLGKSGARDLELSGKMLNNIDILQITDNSVRIGFKDELQAAKMAGNINIDDEWGFSPTDKRILLDFVQDEGLKRIQKAWSGR